MEIKNIGVVGAGSMGHGIAQIMAQAGYNIVLTDIKEEILNDALAKIDGSLSKFVEKGKISQEEKDNIKSRVRTSLRLEDLKDCQLVLEAVLENEELKKNIFKKLDKICGNGTILATNTSSISISAIASVTGRPDKVIGMHFFNPPQIMKLIEVVKGTKTSDATVKVVKSLGEKIGKTPIEVKDSPGFVLNRLLIPMINEAAFLLMNGVAKKEDIDQIMKLGSNHPMGPLELADFIGIDVCVDILESMHKDTGDEKFKPCPLMKDMVAKGFVGKKKKRGFYEYG